jgi:hypothetical protein
MSLGEPPLDFAALLPKFVLLWGFFWSIFRTVPSIGPVSVTYCDVLHRPRADFPLFCSCLCSPLDRDTGKRAVVAEQECLAGVAVIVRVLHQRGSWTATHDSGNCR